jgi:DNA-binding transcriptional ArsR family regulator
VAPIDLDSTFAALADPTRRAIVERLARGPATLHELAQPFPMSPQAVSKHVKVLERAGLVTRGRVAQQRPARLAAPALLAAARWLDTYRRFFEESHERLDDLLKEMQDDTETI